MVEVKKRCGVQVVGHSRDLTSQNKMFNFSCWLSVYCLVYSLCIAPVTRCLFVYVWVALTKLLDNQQHILFLFLILCVQINAGSIVILLSGCSMPDLCRTATI